MYRRALPLPPPVRDRPLHDRGHALPIQPVLASCPPASSTRAPVSPRHWLARWSRAAHGSAQGKSSTRTPQREQSTRRGLYNNFKTSRAASAGIGRAIPAPVARCGPCGIAADRLHSATAAGLDGRCTPHELFGFFLLGHGVRFQAQLFSDKSLYEHLGLSIRCVLPNNFEGQKVTGCCSSACQPASACDQRALAVTTLFGLEPNNSAPLSTNRLENRDFPKR